MLVYQFQSNNSLTNKDTCSEDIALYNYILYIKKLTNWWIFMDIQEKQMNNISKF